MTLLTASSCFSASDSWLPLGRSGLELAPSLFLAEYGVELVSVESLPVEALSAVAMSGLALSVVPLSERTSGEELLECAFLLSVSACVELLLGEALLLLDTSNTLALALEMPASTLLCNLVSSSYSRLLTACCAMARPCLQAQLRADMYGKQLITNSLHHDCQ